MRPVALQCLELLLPPNEELPDCPLAGLPGKPLLDPEDPCEPELPEELCACAPMTRHAAQNAIMLSR